MKVCCVKWQVLVLQVLNLRAIDRVAVSMTVYYDSMMLVIYLYHVDVAVQIVNFQYADFAMIGAHERSCCHSLKVFTSFSG
jgi:hypothetical protein